MAARAAYFRNPKSEILPIRNSRFRPVLRFPADFRWVIALAGAGVGFGLLPPGVTTWWRAVVRDALSPGQAAVQVAVEHVQHDIVTVLRPTSSAEDSRDLRARLELAERANRRLQVQLATLVERERNSGDAGTPVPSGERRDALFVPQLVEARVLGEESASLWRSRKLLGA
jgi:hypothetical protein